MNLTVTASCVCAQKEKENGSDNESEAPETAAVRFSLLLVPSKALHDAENETILISAYRSLFPQEKFTSLLALRIIDVFVSE